MNRRKKLIINSFIVTVAIVITLIVIEIALAFAGLKAIYDPGFEPVTMPGVECNPDTGCIWDGEIQTRGCTDGMLQSLHPGMRYCHMNEDGYFDTESFVDTGNLGQYRILLTGDSITYGYSASIGNSWAEIAESQIQDLDVTVWNAAVGGSGTEQAIVNIERYAPILNPDLVVLGLNLNDITDNTYPMDNWLILQNDLPGSSQWIWVQQYRLTEQFEVEKVDRATLYYRARGVDVLEFSALERLLLRTRTGSLILPRLAGLQLNGNPQIYFERPSGWYEHALPVTAGLIAELNATVQAHGAQLLVLVVPEVNIQPWHPTVLEDVYAILEANGIPYVRIDDLVVPEDYINENPADSHLNDSGHGKAGQRMGACIRDIVLTGTICPQAILPSETP